MILKTTLYVTIAASAFIGAAVVAVAPRILPIGGF